MKIMYIVMIQKSYTWHILYFVMSGYAKLTCTIIYVIHDCSVINVNANCMYYTHFVLYIYCATGTRLKPPLLDNQQ